MPNEFKEYSGDEEVPVINTPLNHGIPAPAATHEAAILPPVKPSNEVNADDKRPVAELLQGLIMTYFVNGNPVVWACDSEPPKDLQSLFEAHSHLADSRKKASFNRPVNERVVRHIRGTLGNAFYAMQQGSKTIGYARLISERERHHGRATTRADIIAKTEAYNAGGDLEKAPLVISPEVDPLVHQAIFSTWEENFLTGLLFFARKDVVNYSLVYYSQFDVINWRDRIEEIKLELSQTASLTPERLADLRKELSMLEPSLQIEQNNRGPSSAEIVSDAARAKVTEAFGPVKYSVLNLLRNLIEVLEYQRDGAIECEKSFFEAHGLPREATSVSRRYDTLIKSIRDQDDRLKSPQAHISHRHVIHPSQTAISGTPFCLEIIPGVL